MDILNRTALASASAVFCNRIHRKAGDASKDKHRLKTAMSCGERRCQHILCKYENAGSLSVFLKIQQNSHHFLFFQLY
jgi:ribosomal protein L32